MQKTRLTPAIALKGTMLSKWKRDVGREVLTVELVIMVEKVFKHSAHPDNDTSIIYDVVEDILDEYWRLKLEQIYLALKKGSNGDYGHIYGRLTKAVIFDWINKLDMETLGEIEDDHDANKERRDDV